MRTLFALRMKRGPKWDATRTRESQEGWREHADFMNELAAKRFILLGGPIDDGVEVLHIIDAPDEPTIRSTLDRDPWSPHLLQIRDIQPWTILLDADEDYA